MKKKPGLAQISDPQEFKFNSHTKIHLKTNNFDKIKGNYNVVNECNAAKKIENYPFIIQKLVWRAFYYKNEIRSRQSIYTKTPKEIEKILKFTEAARHLESLIFKLCKENNLKIIILEEGHV